jgi:hypothetical protein
LTAAAHRHCRFPPHRDDLLRHPLAQRARDRAMAAMGAMVRAGQAAGSPIAYINLQLRHRLYYGLVFLSHRDLADAVLPFYSWDLVEYRLAHAPSFRSDNYRLLFERHFPCLAHVPHDSQVPLPHGMNGQDPAERITRHLTPWSWRLLGRMIGTTRKTSAIVPRKLLRRLPRALIGTPRSQEEVIFLHKINLLEQRLARSNVRLDWNGL